MFDYIIGYVREVKPNMIVLESNNVGYQLSIANPSFYKLGELMKIYTFLHVRDDAFVLYGFKDQEERRLFLKLIDVSGLGPKTVIGMFVNVTAPQLIQAIETSNTAFLKKLPGIGPKAAQQIILDLKGKLVLDSDVAAGVKISTELEETREALKSLGFKVSEIDGVLAKLSKTKATTKEYLKQALKMLNKAKTY